MLFLGTEDYPEEPPGRFIVPRFRFNKGLPMVRVQGSGFRV